jgi:hypothetical protein
VESAVLTNTLVLMMFELNSYSGIIVVEAGIVDWKDLRPFFMRLLPSTRKRLAAMPSIRKSLQEDLRGKCRNKCMRVRVRLMKEETDQTLIT